MAGEVQGSQYATFSTLEVALASGDTEAVLMAFSIERAEFADSEVRAKITGMKDKNQKISDLNQVLAELKAAADGDKGVTLTGDKATMVDEGLKAGGVTPGDGVKITDGDPEAVAELQSVQNLVDGREGLGGYRGDIWWRANDIIDVTSKHGVDLGDINVKTWSTGQQYVGPSGKNEAAWETLETKLADKISEKQNQGTTIKVSDEDLDKLVADVQNAIDGLKSNEQLEMVELQRLVGLQNNSFEMASNLSKKYENTKGAVTRNMS